MTPSIQLQFTPAASYLLRLADTTLILSQRLGEWCGHAPALEEDIALTNMSLDLIGQTRALLTHVGSMQPQPLDEDQLAFLRDERDYRNMTMAELPHGIEPGAKQHDFAFTVLRNLMLATWLRLNWEALETSSDPVVAGIAAKAVKEARYHERHAADWVERLGDGTAQSRRRLEAVLPVLWRHVPELFADDDIDAAASALRLGPRRSDLQDNWNAAMARVMQPLGLEPPKLTAFRGTASNGVHTEHMGYLLAEMQHLQRAHPGGVW